MSRLEVPLKHRTLWATGDILLRAELVLLIKDNLGRYLSGVIDQLRTYCDGTSTPAALHGNLIVEKI
jgi:hypothetical protein